MTSGPLPLVWGRGLGAGLLLVSSALLGMESALLRVLSALMAYPFVCLIVSAALLALTVGGIVVFLFPERFPEQRLRAELGWASALVSAGLLGVWAFFLLLARSPRLAEWLLVPLNRESVGTAGVLAAPGLPFPLLQLAALWLVCAAPLVPGGFVAALLLARFPVQAGRSCGWAFAGAGLGCLAAFLLLSLTDPFAGICALAALAALAALFFHGGSTPRPARASAAALFVVAAGLAVTGGGFVELKFVQGLHQPDLQLVGWSPWSRVAVYPLSGRGERPVGMSRLFQGRLPDRLGLAVDAGGSADIVRYHPGDDLSWARADLRSLPYLLREKPGTLLVGAGGGRDLLVARANSDGPIRAVEVDPLVVRAVQEDVAEFSGRPYSLPGVEGIVAEERAFLRGDAGRYDVVQVAALPGGRPASTGVFTLADDHLVTLEALHDALERLKAGGILAISRPADEKRVLRLAATARAVLAERGSIAPGAQLFIAAERGLAAMLLKTGPFTVAEVRLLERRCRDLGFTVWYSPARAGGGPLYALLQAGREEAISATVGHELPPVTDDRPFSSSALRPADLFRGLPARGQADHEERALLHLRDLLAIALALAAALVALPLALRGRMPGLPRPRAAIAAAYFAAVGLGFIVVGISLLRRFLLLLGRPGGALTVALCVFLLAGALGSWRSRRFGGWRTALRRTCALLVVALMITAVLLPVLVDLLIGSPVWARLLAAVAVMAPLGYLMGQPLPLGAALVRARDARLVPWVWSVVGALTVLGSAGTLVLAAHFGYTATMMVGPASYLVASALAEEL